MRENDLFAYIKQWEGSTEPEDVDDYIHAFNEQWKDVENRYNPEIITLSKSDSKDGTICVSFTVKLPKAVNGKSESPQFYVRDADLKDDKKDSTYRTDVITGTVLIKEGFPAVRPTVFFPRNSIPRHINVFRSGDMCIGNSEETVLSLMFDNIFRACIYDKDPSVANYDSMADRNAEAWQREKEKSGEFPIIDPQLLFRYSSGSLAPIVVPATNGTGLSPIRLNGPYTTGGEILPPYISNN